jgi:hypothetical protein
MFPDQASRFSQDYLSIRWAADGSRLLAVLGYSDGTPICPTIWQYSFASRAVLETNFNPGSETQRFDISPDGNWMVYTACLGPDYLVGDGIYLGDLRTGATRKLADRKTYGTPDEYDWSPDNIHFSFSDSLRNGGFIGDIHGNIEPGCDSFLFIGWIDNQRYMCGRGIMGEVGKNERRWVINSPRGFIWNSKSVFNFVLLR